MTPATGIGLAAYVLALVGITLWARSKRRGTVESFYLADRDVGMFALVATLVASAVNALAVTGTPALFYSGGILYAQMFVVIAVTSALMWLLGPRIALRGRRDGIITQAEYFGSHYGSRAIRIVTALLGLLSLLPFLAAQIVGVGKILSGLSGGQISFEAGVAGCALAIALYVFIGGARAVVATDILQGTIFVIFLFAAAFILVQAVGGPRDMLEQIAVRMPDKLVFSAANLPLFIDNCLSWSFAFFLWPHMFQRLLMARDASRIREVAGFSMAMYTIVVLCILAMAMAATVHFGDRPVDPDRLIAAALGVLWPVGGSVLVVTIFALAMSTIDSIVLTCGSILSRDFRLPPRDPAAEPATTMPSRVLTMGIVAIAIAIVMSDIGQRTVIPLVTLSATIATLALWPLLGSVWRRASAMSAIAAQVCGLAAVLYVFLTGFSPLQPLGVASVGFLVGAVVFVTLSLLRPASM